jgi:FdhD protein
VQESEKPRIAVQQVRAERISTQDPSLPSNVEEICVVEEAAVSIDVDGVETYTILCTPTETRALAAGFLFTEGFITSMAEVKTLEPWKEDPNTIRVILAGGKPRSGRARRNMLVVSSCGSCGSDDLKGRVEALPEVGDALRVRPEAVRAVYGALRERQRLFEACGGTHAAALFDADGKILSSAEDTGRHNALDKAIGKCLLAGITTAGHGVALTSRLSLEMVSKCAWAGIELVTAVSAPTSLAIAAGDRCSMTLCAFVRETRASVFTHPHRLVGRRP